MMKWQGDSTFCQNLDCPNDHEIKVTIFRGTGSCSESCLRAQGVKREHVVTQMALTSEERTMIETHRQKPFTDLIEHHNDQMRRSVDLNQSWPT